MKLPPLPSRRGEHGGVLMVTVMITLLIGVTLASYLMLVRNQSVAVSRSQAWNTALTLAEAGAEEALAQMNHNGGLISAVPGGNGWVFSGGVYRCDPAERELAGGRYAAVYTASASPTIYSTGYVTVPMTSDTVTRVLVIRTTNAPLYSSGLLPGSINRQGNHPVTVDSYDSTLAQYSSSGRYDPARTKSAATTNIATIANTELPEISPPFSTGLPMPPNRSGTYRMSGNVLVQGDLILNDGERLLVSSRRGAVLYVKGSILMSPTATIEVARTSSLEIFVEGGSSCLGILDNRGSPGTLSYFGRPGNTNIILCASNPAVAGAFYAPAATFSATNGSTPIDFEGTLTVDSLLLNRPYRFHFDESLLQPSSPRRGFVVSSWSEN